MTSDISVVIPTSMDISRPGAGGGLETFVRMLATAEETADLDLICLCVGSAKANIGHAKVHIVANRVRSELDYALRLRFLVSSRQIPLPENAVVLAPADHYAWAFLGSSHPIILVAHGAIPETLRLKRGGLQSRLFSLVVESRVARRARFVTAINENVREYFARKYPFLSPSKLVVVPIGVDFRDFEHRPRSSPHDLHNLPKDRPIILFVGRLSPEKGVDLAIAACDHLVNSGLSVCMVIVGNGTQAPHVKQLLGERPWIRWLTHLPPGELLDLMAVSDSLLISSSYEAGPQVLLEAIATGLPVVSSDVGRARELLAPPMGKVVVRNSTEMARALREIMSFDRDAVRRACMATRSRVDFRESARALMELARKALQED